jgi:hypothetical protein
MIAVAVELFLLFSAVWAGQRSNLASEARAVRGADLASSDHFFGLTNLWTIQLTMPKSSWDALQPQGRRRPGEFTREYPWSTCTFECGGQMLTDVAVRFKGNSSFYFARNSSKHPLRLNFGRGQKGRTFMGIKELSLNNNFNDATQFREVLAYDACQRAGLAAPRTAFARVYLKFDGTQPNQYLGLYTLVEPVDGSFLKRNFETKKGLLLKPAVPGLEYFGSDWSAYTNRYQPKTEASPKDIRRFITLTQLIAEADEATFERELPKLLDLDNLLRYVAVTAVLANYDSFIGNGHNYYLFQPAGGGKAIFIPWDLNEAFGGHPMAGPRLRQAEFSVLRPQGGRNRLLERVWANTNWMALYRTELGSILTNSCDAARLKATAETLALVVQSAIEEESPAAWTSFQRIALGKTNLPEPSQGPGPAGPEVISLADWITLRMENVRAELAGQRAAPSPRMSGMRGRRGGPPPGKPGPGGGPPRF